MRLSKNYALRFDDRVTGEPEGAKRPLRMKLMPQKWLKTAIFSIFEFLKNASASLSKKSRRDFFDKLNHRLLFKQAVISFVHFNQNCNR